MTLREITKSIMQFQGNSQSTLIMEVELEGLTPMEVFVLCDFLGKMASRKLQYSFSSNTTMVFRVATDSDGEDTSEEEAAKMEFTLAGLAKMLAGEDKKEESTPKKNNADKQDGEKDDNPTKKKKVKRGPKHHTADGPITRLARFDD